MPRKLPVSERVSMERKLHKTQDDLRTLKRSYKHALSENRKVERALTDALKIRKAKSRLVIKPARRTGGEAVPIILASDWHVGETVTLESTNGMNEYNKAIAQARAECFFRNSLKLVDMFGKDVEIRRVVLGLLGDFISGYIHEHLVASNSMSPVQEAMYVKDLLRAGIQFWLDNSPYRIDCICHVGNHGRMTHRPWTGGANEAMMSLETFVYHALKLDFADEPRVNFLIPSAIMSYVDVLGYTIRFLHGHKGLAKYHGGVGGLYVPVNRGLGRINKNNPAYITCFGHHHQYIDASGPSGGWVANGSLIGGSDYAIDLGVAIEKPTQALFLIDKKRGKTISAPIMVE